MIDSYIYGITALLPLAAFMLVFQVNPYHALVIRGILGAVAALVYTVLGAADVALTEALVGTLLAIALYAVAVRSSLVLRLGVQKETIADNSETNHFKQIIQDLRTIFSKHHMQVELISYPDVEDLQQALLDKEVHAICTKTNALTQVERSSYHTTTRLHRLYDILHTELTSSPTHFIDITAFDSKEKHE